jgi:hypothetical protein
VRRDDVALLANIDEPLPPHFFERVIESGQYRYITDSKSCKSEDFLVWTFAIVLKDGLVLSYRAGPYKEQRDGFMSRRVLGFYSPVAEEDITLFDRADHGVLWNGIKALSSDLDLHSNAEWRALYENTKLTSIVFAASDHSPNTLLAVTAFACPPWLEPTSSRLAINDLQWIDLKNSINHLEDFDPWSQTLLPVARQLALS